jgi:O-methyltransferase
MKFLQKVFPTVVRRAVRAARLTPMMHRMRPHGWREHWQVFRKHFTEPHDILEHCERAVARGDWAELDRLADDPDFNFFDGKRDAIYLHDLDRIERRILLETCFYTGQTAEVIAELVRAVRYVVKSEVPGDLVESGVEKGGSIVIMIRTLQSLGVSDRRIWMYDTFAGMPKPDEIDQVYAQTPVEDGGLKSWELRKDPDGRGSDWSRYSLEAAKDTIERTGYPASLLTYVKGLVEETVPAHAPERIALLRLDTNFYRSTRHELEHLYPRLSTGGVLILDDYGAQVGSRRATDEYFAKLNPPVLLMRIDENVRALVKPAGHPLHAVAVADEEENVHAPVKSTGRRGRR